MAWYGVTAMPDDEVVLASLPRLPNPTGDKHSSITSSFALILNTTNRSYGSREKLACRCGPRNVSRASA
jgi:hypothetical protein